MELLARVRKSLIFLLSNLKMSNSIIQNFGKRKKQENFRSFSQIFIQEFVQIIMMHCDASTFLPKIN